MEQSLPNAVTADGLCVAVGQWWIEFIASLFVEISHCWVGGSEHHNFPWGVWDRKRDRGCFNIFVLLYSCLAKHRARSALMRLGKRHQGWPLSPHPCRYPCPVPYPCNKEAHALYYFLGRVKEAAVKLASSCWDLVKLMATGCQSPRTPCNHGRKSHSSWNVDPCNGSRKNAGFRETPSFIVARSCSHDLKGFMEWCCSLSGHAFSPRSTMSLLLSHARKWGEGRGKVVIYSHMAENDNISQNEQKRVELNLPKFLPCQGKQQLLVRGKRRTWHTEYVKCRAIPREAISTLQVYVLGVQMLPCRYRQAA